MSRPLVIQAEDLSPAGVEFLRQHCELLALSSHDPRFLPALREARGLVVRTYTRVDARLLDGAPNLKVVGRAGVGLDNIDVDACRARGITVVSTPNANTQAVAEYVFALLLDALRPRKLIDHALPLEQWNALRRSLLAPRQLSQLTLGVWGLGKIGSRVAAIAAAVGMRVLYHDLIDIPPEHRAGAACVPRERLLRESDIVSIHVDSRPDNRHIVGDEALALLRSDAMLLNTARGFIVDAHALARFLRANPRATAILDVHDPEPFPAEYPLLGLPNARLSPHIAAATVQGNENMSWVVRDVVRVLGGERPEFAAT